MAKKYAFDLIVSVVNDGFSDYVVETARNAGASGATIIKGRGTSIHETDKFLGISIQPEKELILVLVKKEDRNRIMTEICASAHLNEQGKGLCFSLPVSNMQGIAHLLVNSQKEDE
ncbi:MAG: P-II family nitrogen regulator [Clostridia bacterium]